MYICLVVDTCQDSVLGPCLLLLYSLSLSHYTHEFPFNYYHYGDDSETKMYIQVKSLLKNVSPGLTIVHFRIDMSKRKSKYSTCKMELIDFPSKASSFQIFLISVRSNTPLPFQYPGFINMESSLSSHLPSAHTSN